MKTIDQAMIDDRLRKRNNRVAPRSKVRTNGSS